MSRAGVQELESWTAEWHAIRTIGQVLMFGRDNDQLLSKRFVEVLHKVITLRMEKSSAGLVHTQPLTHGDKNTGLKVSALVDVDGLCSSKPAEQPPSQRLNKHLSHLARQQTLIHI